MYNDDVGAPYGFHGYCALALPLPAPLLVRRVQLSTVLKGSPLEMP